MVFDKTKAMRNAERFLAQGKIQSAIAEYRQVVANDSKDFGTLNMLGDLYTKNSETKQAIKCYTSVAEHYSKQGFAQKAIAVYNKICKLAPNSIEISAKLADLYKFKGAVNEARQHYLTVAEHYESSGQKIEALEVRKQIASLDPNDTNISLDLAAAYLSEGQNADAAEAYGEAGVRFAKKNKHTEAIESFEKALNLEPGDSRILAAFAQSHFAVGTADQAADRLSEIYAANGGDRDVLEVLIDCHLEAGNTADAEKFVIRMVEQEPASYPKFLDVAKAYLKSKDAEAAGRVTAILSEHLLLAGKADEFQELLTEILLLDPDQLEALRLKARLAAWQRDEAGMYESLVQLATVAKERESIDDERLALGQLVMIAPQESRFGERLREINEQYGYEDSYGTDSLFDEQFMKARTQQGPEPESEPEIESFHIVASEDDIDELHDSLAVADFEITTTDGDLSDVAAEFDEPETDAEKISREIDSIKFYIDSEYYELADKAIAELRTAFGKRAEIDEITEYLRQSQAVERVSEPIVSEATVSMNGSAPKAVSTNGNSSGLGIDDLRNELGIDEVDAADDSDYDTHYHTAVAYQEMGLLDEAIREFQEAVSLVQANDTTRRFFHCANLIGHCFMQKGMANLALTWYQRALETPGLSDEEKQGIWYELASAYEAEGDLANAGRYFEQVYAENINFRDVGERVRNIVVGR